MELADVSALPGWGKSGATDSPPQLAARRERRIGAFEPAIQKHIHKLTAGSPALEDLAESFPALLFALATGHATPALRACTIGLVEGGAPLRHAATVLGLPFWLRHLPASALQGSLDGLPSAPEHAQRLTNFMPQDAVQARLWLAATAYGCRACGEEFGMWIATWAGRLPGLLVPHGTDTLRMLSVWGWASMNPAAQLAVLVRRPWAPAMSPRRALEEMLVWRQRVDLALHLASRPASGDIGAGRANGYDFVPLTTAAEFIAEAEAMDNCLDQYGDRLAARRSHIVSIRRDDRRVAVVEIGTHEEEPTMPAIRQLRAARNRRASADIWRASYTWLGMQPLRALQAGEDVPSAPARRTAAETLWREYIEARSASLTAGELKALTRAIAVRGGVPATSARTERRHLATIEPTQRAATTDRPVGDLRSRTTRAAPQDVGDS